MPVSVSIDVDELARLRNYILSRRLKRIPTTNKYELLRIKDGDVNIVVYKSSRLVHNDSLASREIIDFILKREREFGYLLGSDEVGKGEWFGPLVTTCVALRPEDILNFRKLGVRDSKLIKKNEIRKLAQEIFKTDVIHRSVILMPEIYNKRYAEFKREGKSLNDFLAWSHVTAIRDNLAYLPATSAKIKIIIDKFDVKKTDLRLSRANLKQRNNVEIIQSSKGDMEIPVSVASIIAKHTFEERVNRLSKQFNLDLRNISPEEIDPKILPFVSKTHFKNISKLLT